MKKYIYGTVFALAIVGFYTAKVFSANKAVDTVKLEKKNTLVMRDVFTEDTVGAVQAKALELSSKLGANEPIYLYMDSPGGSIVDGQHLISTLQALPQEIKTITSFAASMGFITVENLGERLSTPDGVYMSHRAKVGLQGQLPGEVNTRLQFWSDVMTGIEGPIAARLGLNLPDYQKKIKDEYWISGQNAVDAHVADKVVAVQCGADMQGTSEQTVQTIFGAVVLTYSDCPLISTPLKISFSQIETSSNEIEQFKQFFSSVIMDKRSFAEDGLIREQFYKYVK